MSPVVLFRKMVDSAPELQSAAAHLPVVELRSRVPPQSLVIGRYSCLPYYHELEQDLAANGSWLINDSFEHDYIARFDYYYDIAAHTFPTWFAFAEVPLERRNRPLVVKGRTNSRKLQWNTHMYAPDFPSALRLGQELMNDPFIGPQGLIIREYVPLETFELGLNEVPITNEWRLFFYREQLLAYGYYWALIDDLRPVEAATPDFLAQGIPFAQTVAAILSEHTNFFVLDIAKTAAGEWKVVEVNDGQQSGLNGFVPAETLYRALAEVLAGPGGARR